jgi:hypothetical protein
MLGLSKTVGCERGESYIAVCGLGSTIHEGPSVAVNVSRKSPWIASTPFWIASRYT